MADSWEAFLRIRALLIDEFLIEGETCTKIAQTLSMDPGQVWLISRSSDHPTVQSMAPPSDAMDAIIKHRAEMERLALRIK
jgi:hypothetical protein